VETLKPRESLLGDAGAADIAPLKDEHAQSGARRPPREAHLLVPVAVGGRCPPASHPRHEAGGGRVRHPHDRRRDGREGARPVRIDAGTGARPGRQRLERAIAQRDAYLEMADALDRAALLVVRRPREAAVAAAREAYDEIVARSEAVIALPREGSAFLALDEIGQRRVARSLIERVVVSPPVAGRDDRGSLRGRLHARRVAEPHPPAPARRHGGCLMQSRPRLLDPSFRRHLRQTKSALRGRARTIRFVSGRWRSASSSPAPRHTCSHSARYGG
jgi:hypothetical protein